jgi:hypothetical protein
MPQKALPNPNAIQARRLQPKLHAQSRNHPFRIDGLLLVKRRCELRSNPKAESYCSTHPSFLRLRPKATTCSCNSRPALTWSENQSRRSGSHSDRTVSCVFIDPLSSTVRTSKRSNPRRRESAVCVCDPVRSTTSGVDTPAICGCWLKPGLMRSRDRVSSPGSLRWKLKCVLTSAPHHNSLRREFLGDCAPVASPAVFADGLRTHPLAA